MNHTLKEAAAQVLENNWKEGFTIPCEGLYPFQWYWDSGFIALGWMHLDLDRAFQEINSLLSGQWSNGFIPHIVFHNPSDSYFPGADVQASHLSLFAPGIPTSGITQPPVLGWVLGEMYAFAKANSKDSQPSTNGNDTANSKIISFLNEAFDKVYKQHEYLYTARDPQDEGLVYICHNWEAGTDNTPVWDDIWTTMDAPEYELDRKDNLHIAASHRPSNREYQYYIHLIELFKSWKYDDATIAEKSPFLVQDPLFNAMLIASNTSLIEIGQALNKTEQVAQLLAWNAKSKKAYNHKLYDAEHKAYVYYDLRNERALPYVSSSSFAALFAGIPSQERAAEICAHFEKGAFSGENQELLLCASFDPTHERFDAQRYWRGPIWINLNWIIYKGLVAYECHKLAQQIKEDTLHLINTYGFYEYFDPRKEEGAHIDKGYGGNNFSWSAALTIDLITPKTT